MVEHELLDVRNWSELVVLALNCAERLYRNGRDMRHLSCVTTADCISLLLIDSALPSIGCIVGEPYEEIMWEAF